LILIVHFYAKLRNAFISDDWVELCRENNQQRAELT